MFRILYVETGEYASADIFSDAKAANEAAIKIKNETGKRTRIKREVASDGWRVREAARLLDGTYKPLPDWWQSADWWRGSVASADHFAHVASDGKRIAYTQSPEKGEEDKQTVIPASTYLARYFGNVLRSEQIASIAHSLDGEAYTLHVEAEASPETFEKVYEGMPGGYSCMRYNRKHFRTPNHPAFVYGAGDLGIAWITAPGAGKFEPAARAVIRPAKNAYIRIYGETTEHEEKLKHLLEKAGFTAKSDMSGVRLLKVELPCGDYLMPYLDGAAQSVDDLDSEHFIVRRSGEYDASQTDGRLRMGSRYTCENCGDRMHEDECHDVQGALWCEGCYENEAGYCERYDESYPSCDLVSVNVERGRQQTWSEDAARNEAFQDDISGEYWCNNNYTSIDVYTARGLQTWCAEEHDNYFDCENTGNAYSCDDYTLIEVNTRGGSEIWCKEETDGEWFLCEDCGEFFASDMRYSAGGGQSDMFPYGDVCEDCGETREDAEESGTPLFVIGSGRIEDAAQLELPL